MSKLPVTVLIPNYNHGKFLRESIDSALHQDDEDIRVFVVDDGSTDDSRTIIDSYGERIDALFLDHCGVYTLRQKALEQIHTPYFINLDADNRLKPDAVRRMKEALDASDDSVVFAYGQREVFSAHATTVSQFPDFSKERLREKNYLDMGALIRTQAAKEVGFDSQFNDGMGDYDFFLSLVQKGYRGVLVDEIVCEYRSHGQSLTGRAFVSGLKLRTWKRLLNKHREFFGEELCRSHWEHVVAKTRHFLQQAPSRNLTREEKFLRRMNLIRLEWYRPDRLLRGMLITFRRNPSTKS
ncbi:MAG: glycosyltransferase family 2 protein [Puniceicoccales bacterium]